jgi:hypothetical protein
MWWDNTRHTIHKKLQTRFYYDILDLNHFVVLQQTKYLLRELDKKRGYVERSWFLDKYKNAVQGLRLTKRSCLVECVIEKDDPKELFRVYVR